MRNGFFYGYSRRNGIKYIVFGFVLLSGFFAGVAGYAMLGEGDRAYAAAEFAAGLSGLGGGDVFLRSFFGNIRLLAAMYICGLLPIGIPIAAFLAGAKAFAAGQAAALLFSLGLHGRIFVLTGRLLQNVVTLGGYLVFCVIAYNNAVIAYNNRRSPRGRKQIIDDIRRYTVKTLAAAAPFAVNALLEMSFLQWMQNITR